MQRNILIDHDPETSHVYIKTDSAAGGPDQLDLNFLTSDGTFGGGLVIYFWNPPQYQILECLSSTRQFPGNLPADVNTVWKVTLTKTSDIRFVVHCNGVKVIDQLIADPHCDDSNWSGKWSQELGKIKFGSTDSASDYYRSLSKGSYTAECFFNLKCRAIRSPH